MVRVLQAERRDDRGGVWRGGEDGFDGHVVLCCDSVLRFRAIDDAHLGRSRGVAMGMEWKSRRFVSVSEVIGLAWRINVGM